MHAEGRTIVVITHEDEVAACAQRLVRLRDGVVVDDRRARLMGGRDTLRIALLGITSNKLRSALTVLGVAIGVAAVVILVAVGTGSSRAVAEQINRLGTNTLTVFNTGRFGGGHVDDRHAVALLVADDRRRPLPPRPGQGAGRRLGVACRLHDRDRDLRRRHVQQPP